MEIDELYRNKTTGSGSDFCRCYVLCMLFGILDGFIKESNNPGSKL